MLKLLLPWRDFEKEKPDEWSFIVVKTDDFEDEDLNGFDEIEWTKEHYTCEIKYWIYKEELLATLPEKEE